MKVRIETLFIGNNAGTVITPTQGDDTVTVDGETYRLNRSHDAGPAPQRPDGYVCGNGFSLFGERAAKVLIQRWVDAGCPSILDKISRVVLAAFVRREEWIRHEWENYGVSSWGWKPEVVT